MTNAISAAFNNRSQSALSHIQSLLQLEDNKPIIMTLADMIDKDILYRSLDKMSKYKGFTIGRKGKQMYWHFIPTQNGYYKIYPQFEDGNLGYPKYVDANKTIVTIHLREKHETFEEMIERRERIEEMADGCEEDFILNWRNGK